MDTPRNARGLGEPTHGGGSRNEAKAPTSCATSKLEMSRIFRRFCPTWDRRTAASAGATEMNLPDELSATRMIGANFQAS